MSLKGCESLWICLQADGSAGSLPDAELIRPANYASSSGEVHDRRQPRHRQINQVHDPPAMQPQQQQSLPGQVTNPGLQLSCLHFSCAARTALRYIYMRSRSKKSLSPMTASSVSSWRWTVAGIPGELQLLLGPDTLCVQCPRFADAIRKSPALKLQHESNTAE